LEGGGPGDALLATDSRLPGCLHVEIWDSEEENEWMLLPLAAKMKLPAVARRWYGVVMLAWVAVSSKVRANNVKRPPQDQLHNPASPKKRC